MTKAGTRFFKSADENAIAKYAIVYYDNDRPKCMKLFKDFPFKREAFIFKERALIERELKQYNIDVTKQIRALVRAQNTK